MKGARAELLPAIASGLICLTLLYVILHSAAFILIPIAWSVFLSVTLSPLCDWLEERHFSRIVAIMASIVLVALVIGVVMYGFINQAMGLLEYSPVMERKITDYIQDLQFFILKYTGQFGGKDAISWNFSEFLNRRDIGLFLQATLETLIMIGIIPVYVFFLIYYRDFFNEFLTRLTAKKGKLPLLWVNEAILMIQNYLKGLFLVTVLVALMAGIVFYFMGISYFLFFALFIALFNLIPYIGVILSSVITVLYVLITTDSFWYPFFTLAFLWAIQLIENNLITPIVVGAKIQLNPLAVIIAIMVGGQVWGISGIILFIPLVGVLKIIFDRVEFLRPYGYLLGTDIPIVEKGRIP